MILIDDEIHCEWCGRFETFSDALAELNSRSTLPWDEEPNRAPCSSWRTCGRRYQLIEYDDSVKPWKELRRVPVLEMSAGVVKWLDGAEAAWAERGNSA